MSMVYGWSHDGGRTISKMGGQLEWNQVKSSTISKAALVPLPECARSASARPAARGQLRGTSDAHPRASRLVLQLEAYRASDAVVGGALALRVGQRQLVRMHTLVHERAQTHEDLTDEVVA